MKNVMENYRHQEGKLTEKIEEQTAKIPSDVFLWSAIGSMAISAVCHLRGKRKTGLFFGQWAAPFLLFGVYNKMVKQSGHDKDDLS